MIPCGFENFRILQAVGDQFEKHALANFQSVSRAYPIYKVSRSNETIFEILMTYQSRTKVWFI